MKRTLILAAIFGVIYPYIEIVFNAVVTFLLTGSIAFKGQTSLWMSPVGAIMGLILGGMDEIRWIRENVNMVVRCLIGMTMIYAIEFGSGMILNIAWGLDIWKYTDFANIMGQITLLFIPLWYLICPFAFWLDNVIRWWLDIEPIANMPDNLINYYRSAMPWHIMDKTGSE